MSVKGYEEGLHNAMIKAKIEYVAKTPKPNTCNIEGDFVEELEYYKHNAPGMKSYLKEIGFKIRQEYQIDGDRWFDVDKNISISNDGFVIKRKNVK